MSLKLIKNQLVSLVIISSLSSLSACSSDESILATINGREITQSQFDAYLKLKRIPQQNEQRVQQELTQYIEREALADAISEQQLLQDALVEAELNEFRKQLLISRYFEKHLQDAVSEQAIHNYYNSHPDLYSSTQVHVAHILIRTNPAMSEVERQALLTKAHEAYSKAISGTEFKELALSYSEDKRSAKQGGDLGWLKEGAVDPLFSQKAFAMKVGDISEPFATTFGLHVIKVLDAPKVIQRPFDKVKGDIRYQLRQETKQAEVERLKASNTIKLL